MHDLLPCPWCGSAPQLDDDTMGHSVVVCYSCMAQAGFGPDDAAAIERWNTRLATHSDRALPDREALDRLTRAAYTNFVAPYHQPITVMVGDIRALLDAALPTAARGSEDAS